MANDRAVNDAFNDNLRAALREVMVTRGWNQDRVASEFQITQQNVSSFLSGRSGASLLLAWQIAKVHGSALDAVLSGQSRQPLGSLLAWREHIHAARSLFAHVPAAAFEAVGSLSGPTVPAAITPAVIGGLAEAWWKGDLSAAAAAADAEAASHTRYRSGSG